MDIKLNEFTSTSRLKVKKDGVTSDVNILIYDGLEIYRKPILATLTYNGTTIPQNKRFGDNVEFEFNVNVDAQARTVWLYTSSDKDPSEFYASEKTYEITHINTSLSNNTFLYDDYEISGTVLGGTNPYDFNNLSSTCEYICGGEPPVPTSGTPTLDSNNRYTLVTVKQKQTKTFKFTVKLNNIKDNVSIIVTSDYQPITQ